MPRDSELDRLRTELNGAWDAKEYAKSEMDKAWEKVINAQTDIGRTLDALKDQHDRTFQRAQEARENSQACFRRGDHDGAARYSQDARNLMAELPPITNRRQRLIADIRRIRANHGGARDAYLLKKRDYEHAKERFDDYKAEKKAQDERKMYLVGVPPHYGDDVKIVQESDGTTSVYFGGIGKPDGPGHGHYVVDQFGNISYRRDPFAPHGPQNRR